MAQGTAIGNGADGAMVWCVCDETCRPWDHGCVPVWDTRKGGGEDRKTVMARATTTNADGGFTHCRGCYSYRCHDKSRSGRRQNRPAALPAEGGLTRRIARGKILGVRPEDLHLTGAKRFPCELVRNLGGRSAGEQAKGRCRTAMWERTTAWRLVAIHKVP